MAGPFDDILAAPQAPASSGNLGGTDPFADIVNAPAGKPFTVQVQPHIVAPQPGPTSGRGADVNYPVPSQISGAPPQSLNQPGPAPPKSFASTPAGIGFQARPLDVTPQGQPLFQPQQSPVPQPPVAPFQPGQHQPLSLPPISQPQAWREAGYPMSMGAAAQNELVQGLTAGYEPQIAGALAAIPGYIYGEPPLARYNRMVQEEQAYREALRSNYPISSAAGGFFGTAAGIETGVGALKAAAPRVAAAVTRPIGQFLPQAAGPFTRTAATAADIALQSAGIGGLQASGEAPIDPNETFQESAARRLDAALEAAPWAAATGVGLAGIVGAAPYVVKGVRKLAGVFRPGDPQARAFDILKQDFASDGIDINDAMAKVDAANAAGQPMRLADVGGPAVKRRINTMARMPQAEQNAVRQFLDMRQRGEGLAPTRGAPIAGSSVSQVPSMSSEAERVAGAISDALPQGEKGAARLGAAIMKRRAETAERLYPEVDKHIIDYNSQAGQKLHELLQRIPQRVRQSVYERMKVRGEPGSEQLIWDMVQGPSGPHFELKKVPNMKQWRMIRTRISRLINAGTDIAGHMTPEAEDLVGLKSEISDALREENPKLKNADGEYADASDMLQALRLGTKAADRGIGKEIVEMQLDKMGAGEREMYQAGYLDKLRQVVANTPDMAEAAKSVAGTENLRKKMQLILPDAAARDKLMGFLQNEKAMNETLAGARFGSQTIERSLEQESVENVAKRLHEAGEWGRVATRAWLTHGLSIAPDLVFQAWRHLNKFAKINPNLRNDVLRNINQVALNPNPATMQAFANSLQNVPPGVARPLKGLMMNFIRTKVTPAVTAKEAQWEQAQPGLGP